jgi:uncharacterized iron-regulated protein
MSFISYESLIDEIKGADFVFIGEEHNNHDHHIVQLDIIRALKSAGLEVAVGLEMFRADHQHELYSWVKGETTFDDFRRIFEYNWSYPWRIYKDIFLYTKDHAIPMIGLNVPREITRKVSERGFASLTSDELMKLPIGISCDVDGNYREFIRIAHKAHGKNGKPFEYFCEAQLVWDKVMSWYLVDYLKRNPGAKIVVLAGANHSWKKGIPEQIRKQSNFSYKVVFPSMEIPDETLTPDYLDYLLIE